jgi:hypothetical protein
MQEVIADLPLRERAELGRQFDKVIRHVQAQAHGYAQATARADARPDWIFVFGASKTWERASLLATVEPVMRAALYVTVTVTLTRRSVLAGCDYSALSASTGLTAAARAVGR